MQPIYLSSQKHTDLSAELELLRGTRRKEIADQLEYARSLGDLSENAEYQQARQMQGEIEARIRELEAILKYAVIVDQHHSDVIEIGSTVTVQKKNDEEKKIYQIVGSEEADMLVGKISLNSPLGQAMLGKKKGETFIFETPAGKKVEYKIIKIA